MDDIGEECIKVGWAHGKKERGLGSEQSRCPQSEDQNKTTVMTAIVVKKLRVLAGLRGEWRRRMKDREVWRQAMGMTK